MIMEVTEETAALELLELPALDTLTERQVRGQTCVWDAAQLHGRAAVDLGKHETKRAGSPVLWFPRGCPRCVADAALRALHAHAPSCEQCVDDAERCPDGVALRRLMREARRAPLSPTA